jgi:hypothetical protein
MQLENLTSFIGTEVKGIDLREPVSDEDFAVLRERSTSTRCCCFAARASTRRSTWPSRAASARCWATC